MRRVIAFVFVLLAFAATDVQAQVVSPGSPMQMRQQAFLVSGTWTVPADVTQIFAINGCGAGGSGAGGQSGGATSGSSGGGAAVCLDNDHCDVTPGATITITMTVPNTQTAVGGTGADGATTTLAGCNGLSLTMLGGHGGIASAAGVGGVGAASAFNGRGFGGNSGIAKATAGTGVGNASTTAISSIGQMRDGMGSGGGSDTAGVAGAGGGWGSHGVNGQAGSGNVAGSGGGASYWGNGQNGTASGSVDCAASPVWVGFGGGGCGGGSGGKGGPGGPPFVRFSYFTATGQ